MVVPDEIVASPTAALVGTMDQRMNSVLQRIGNSYIKRRERTRDLDFAVTMVVPH